MFDPVRTSDDHKPSPLADIRIAFVLFVRYRCASSVIPISQGKNICSSHADLVLAFTSLIKYSVCPSSNKNIRLRSMRNEIAS